MPHRVTQPTKEQVRAYMQARRASHGPGQPPPSPEEIRALLGWRLQRGNCSPVLVPQFYLIPTVYGRLATTLVCDFLLLTLRLSHLASRTHQKFT